ncbi:MAG TPA: GGDEF domain-containing protein [Candidatus Hydrogenedentes bacterium]|nr:GGDEF domain-containing protein [Candidatus Hydrogenedentota bacterium]
MDPEVDRLTGLRTRDAFEKRFSEVLEEVRSGSGSVSVGIVDIDLLGRINVEHGREMGDEVFLHVALEMSESFGPAGEVFRFGGDALSVLWRDLEKEQAFLVLEQFRIAMQAPYVVKKDRKSREVTCTICAGLASFPEDGGTAYDLIVKASEALYRAKVSGRNKVCLAREEKMVTKTSHYTQGQLMGLRRLAEREGIGEAVLLREGLNDLLRKYNTMLSSRGS